jgi:hypothetical protein
MLKRPGEQVARALSRMPRGTFRARSLGVDWVVTRSVFAKGASEKLVARALQGPGYISANLYHLESGPRLRPCEMPVARVLDFIEGLEPWSNADPDA